MNSSSGLFFKVHVCTEFFCECVFAADVPDNGQELQDTLQNMTGQRTVPNVFIKGKHLGGCDDTMKANAEGRLAGLINPGATNSYEYDLIVIGGGSGGLAASKV